MTDEIMTVKRRRSLEEARDEVEREFNVRSRCFVRWVSEGRMSRTDAQDRLDRLATALEYIRGIPEAGEAESAGRAGS